MAISRYDTPAQAEFINTYVPIPFEQLYTLGKEAKADVDKALSEQSSALAKWSEFKSPSAVDTDTWYNATVGAAKPIIDELSSNPDMIKTAEGRSKLRSVINNVDVSKLAQLQQSRDALLQRQKVDQELMIQGKYNPEWHGVDYTNYNTLNKGIFSDVAPLAYQSIQELTDPYYKGIQDSFIATKGGYDYRGVTPEKIAEIADQNLSGIMITPEAKKHMDIYKKQTGASDEEAKSWLRERVIQDNLKYSRINREANDFAKIAAATRASREKEPPKPLVPLTETMNYTGASKVSESFDRGIDTFANISKKLKPETFKAASPYIQNIMKVGQELAELVNTKMANPDLKAAKYKEYMKSKSEFASKFGKDVYKSIYMANSANQDPDKPGADEYSSANHLSGITGVLRENTWEGGRDLIKNILVPKMAGFTPTSYTNEGGVKMDDGVFLKSSTHGMHLPETLATLMMGSKNKEGRTVDGKDFNIDLQSGRFSNVIAEPTGNIVTYYDASGKLVHELEMETSISEKSLKDAGYSNFGLLSKVGAGAAVGAGAGAGIGALFGGAGALPGAGIGGAIGGIGAGVYSLFDDDIAEEMQDLYGAKQKVVKSGKDDVNYITIKTYMPIPNNKLYNDRINQTYYGDVANSTVKGNQLYNTQSIF